MPKHRTVYFVTDEEARVLELASLAMKYVGFDAVQHELLRLVQSSTLQSTPKPESQETRRLLKPNTATANPTVRNGPWLAKQDPRTPNVPQVE